MTKKNRAIIDAYKFSDRYSLYQAYGRFSSAKAKAWEYCEQLMIEKGGRGLKVIGANSSFFSAGFLYEEDDVKKLMYITKGGNHEITLEG